MDLQKGKTAIQSTRRRGVCDQRRASRCTVLSGHRRGCRFVVVLCGWNDVPSTGFGRLGSLLLGACLGKGVVRRGLGKIG